MPVNIIAKSSNLRNSTLITGFHGVGETGYISVSYLVHALNAQRIGFVDVAHPPPLIATSETGLVTPFEVYRAGKIVLVKLEFSRIGLKRLNSLSQSPTGLWTADLETPF